MGHSRPLFLYFRLFNTDLKQLIENKICQCLDLLCRKQLLYQLSHDHCHQKCHFCRVHLRRASFFQRSSVPRRRGYEQGQLRNGIAQTYCQRDPKIKLRIGEFVQKKCQTKNR